MDNFAFLIILFPILAEIVMDETNHPYFQRQYYRARGISQNSIPRYLLFKLYLPSNALFMLPTAPTALCSPSLNSKYTCLLCTDE